VRYSEDKQTVFVYTAKPVKGFVLEEDTERRLSDNGFDLVPGEMKEVHVEGLATTLRWRYVEM